MAYPPPEEVSGPHPTQETRPQSGNDMRLREHGFFIVSRPKKGQAIWGRNNKTYTERQAVKICDGEC